jgi:uridylate kinase
MSEKIVISLGGSIINPGEINLAFLKKFRALILKYSRGRIFYIITGGGAPARQYQTVVRKLQKNSLVYEDSVGIAATRLNAELLRALFGKKAKSEIFHSPFGLTEVKPGEIIIGGGFKPGNSSDLVAVALAKEVGASTVLNLSNIDYVFDKDPHKYKDAKPQQQVSWKDFLKIVGTKWSPGGNFPFDPIASKFAQKANISVIVMNGKKLANLRDYLSNEKIKGTMLK